MFQSITLDRAWGKINDPWTYELIDSDFECCGQLDNQCSQLMTGRILGSTAMSFLYISTKEYRARGLPVRENIHLCNLYLFKFAKASNSNFYSYASILEWQYKLINKYYSEIEYKEFIDIWNKYRVFL